MDVPGRKNNLYKEPFGGLHKQIDESYVDYGENKGAICYEGVAGHMNHCYGNRVDVNLPIRLPYKDAQLDFTVEKQYVQQLRKYNVLIILLVLLLLVFYFAKRSRSSF